MQKPGVVLLVELTVKSEKLEELKTILARTHQPTLAEPGCIALFETSREDDPNKLVFFEVFQSEEAHAFHLEQDYTKEIMKAFGTMLAEPGRITKLRSL